MADLYTHIAEQPREVVDAMATALEGRANDSAMQAITARYLSRVEPPADSRVLEVGCGAGAATRHLIRHLDPAELVGIDPSPDFIELAKKGLAGEERASLRVGDATASGEPDAAFDVVVAHTVYSHLRDPQGALAEAFRVLKPGGRLAIFDGDYATTTVALFDGDPLQSAIGMAQRNMVNAPYIMRRLPALAEQAGFVVTHMEPHGFVQTTSPDYMLSLISRGTNAAAAAGEIGTELAESYQKEAHKRVADGTFYGAILFMSLIAEKPAA